MEPTVMTRRGEKGESLVEVLAALAILLLVMVGVLQLFTMALMGYRVSQAQNEMTAKAQAVVEVIRLVRSLDLPTASSGGILPLSSGEHDLPRASSDTNYDFWGPNGFGVVQPGAKYHISYEVQNAGSDFLVTVFVEPGGSSGSSYLGPVGQKGIRYAATLPQ